MGAMVRRAIIGLGLIACFLAAVAVVATSNATLVSAGPFPWTPTVPTPSVSDNELSPAGGLGNTRQDLERAYGAPAGLQGTMISYLGGAYAVSYDQDRAVHLLVNFGNGQSSNLD